MTDVIIPANDDSIKAVEILLDQLAAAIAESKTMVRREESGTVAPVRQARTRSRRVLASARDDESSDDSSAVIPEPADTKTNDSTATEPTDGAISEAAESSAQ